MAHDISTVNGTDEAFYALKPAWHGLGTMLDNAPDSETAIRAAHLDWSVELQPLQTPARVSVPDHFASVRADSGDVLDVVGSRYTVVQNREAFAFLDGLLQDGIMRYESAGALRGGRQVWILARMPSVDQIAEGDDCLRYVLFSTSHDGTACIHAVPTSVRVVCANTLRIATDGDIGIRHTADVRNQLDYARRYLSQFDERFTLFRDEARTLAERRYSPQQARDYVEALFPTPKQDGRARTIRERKVAKVRRNFASPRQSMPSIKGSWWTLYNSVSELIDHGTSRRGKTARDRAENRMIATIDGTGAAFKDKAFRLAVQMAS